MAQASDGKTVSRSRISGCSGDLHRCHSVHDRFCIQAMAETLDMQPRQHPGGHPRLLCLVVCPRQKNLKRPGSRIITWVWDFKIAEILAGKTPDYNCLAPASREANRLTVDGKLFAQGFDKNLQPFHLVIGHTGGSAIGYNADADSLATAVPAAAGDGRPLP